MFLHNFSDWVFKSPELTVVKVELVELESFDKISAALGLEASHLGIHEFPDDEGKDRGKTCRAHDNEALKKSLPTCHTHLVHPNVNDRNSHDR